MPSQWVVGKCRPLHEFIAAVNIKQQQHDYYLPQIYDHRLRRRVPLFGPYIFVCIDMGNWRWLAGTRGIREILMDAAGESEPKPSRIHPSIITGLKARENGNGVIDMGERFGLRINDQARVRSGPYTDQIVIYRGMNASNRAAVLLSLIGRDIEMQISPYMLEPMRLS